MKRISPWIATVFLLMVPTLVIPNVNAHIVLYTTTTIGPLYQYNFTVTHNGSPNGNPIRGFFLDANGATITVISSPQNWTGYQVGPYLVVWNITGPPGQSQIPNGGSLSGFVIQTTGILGDGPAMPFFVVWHTLQGGDYKDASQYLDSGIHY